MAELGALRRVEFGILLAQCDVSLAFRIGIRENAQELTQTARRNPRS
jgi:hypothetical protein